MTSLSLKSEHVSGRVVGPSGDGRSFRSVMRCIEEHDHASLKPGGKIYADLTLLRGAERALFPAPGLHTVEVDVAWEMDGMPVRVSGSAPVMVTPPVDDSHAAAATKALTTPDLLLTLAIGGDHLSDGNDALEAAMADKTLAPHFAIVKAKNTGRKFGERKANPAKALAEIPAEAVLSPSEVKHVAKMAEDIDGPKRKTQLKPIMPMLKESAAGDQDVEAMLKKL